MAIEYSPDWRGRVIVQCKPAGRIRGGIRTLERLEFEPFHVFAATYATSEWRKVWLAFKLQQSAETFFSLSLFDHIPSNANVVRFLKNNAMQFSKLADGRWNRRPAGEALRAIQEAADRWASKQTFETLNRFGFHRQEVSEHYTDYGSASVIRQWFAVAEVMALFVGDAINARASNGSPRLFSAEPSKEQWLYGIQLPDLYTRLTGQTFGFSRSDNKLNATGGAGFVIAAARAMGLETTPSNVEYHRRQAKLGGDA